MYSNGEDVYKRQLLTLSNQTIVLLEVIFYFPLFSFFLLFRIFFLINLKVAFSPFSWRTPGFEYKEDIATGSMAAAAGGYTFVNLMPNTKPVCSSAAQAAMVEQKAAEVGLCDVNQTVSITENFDGKVFTRNFSQPSFRKPTICLAAAIPALILASAVWAPIFFGVEK